ncbi:MAG: TfoX/Sxy family protein [Desulforhopalus sp.]
MAYDEDLAARVRAILDATEGYSEKKMFGGICCLVNGNMACGITGDSLIVRVGKEGYEAALNLPHTSEFDMTGRVMTGWVMVGPSGIASQAALKQWLITGVQFASSLQPK